MSRLPNTVGCECLGSKVSFGLALHNLVGSTRRLIPGRIRVVVTVLNVVDSPRIQNDSRELSNNHGVVLIVSPQHVLAVPFIFQEEAPTILVEIKSLVRKRVSRSALQRCIDDPDTMLFPAHIFGFYE